MTDEGEVRPRRAFPPPEGDDAAPDRQGSWEHASGGDAPGTASATPIPPPAVLPASQAATASAGRRFSADELPDDEERPLPRRSALTPTRPDEHDGPDTPAVGDAPDDERPDAAATPEAEPDAAAEGTSRRVWPWVAAAAVVVAGGVLTASLLSGGLPGASPAPSVDPVATYLLQDADLAGLTEGVEWLSASTDTAIAQATPQAKCFASGADGTPRPQSSLVRTFAPATGQAGGLLHQVDAYATAEDAAAAYATRLAELASCARNTAWLLDTQTVTGLADESAATRIVLQDTADEYHTLLLSRTGRRVNLVDQTSPESAAEVGPLATTLAVAAQRQCTDGGACPATVATEPSAPLPVAPNGWLASVDLPRVTPGAGTWRGTDMTEMRLAGSRCEAVDLVNVPGATAAAQRTYLLGDDSAAPVGFGVDEAIYTFASVEEATATKDTLVGNMDGCASRTPTATVTRVADLGEGAGAAWSVSQQTDRTAAMARFRVGVQAVGPHVIYLMANPSETTDFTDEAWTAIAHRAAARAAELG